MDTDHVKMPGIFDEGERTLEGGASHLISAFDYLNESARDMAGEVRQVIDTFFERYPGEHQDALRRRTRTRRDDQHHAAMFELLLHEMLLRSGCTIEAVEPQVAATNNRPDFLVRAADGERFYIEGVTPSGRSNVDAGAERRMDEALSAIDGVQSPNFLLAVLTTGLPSQPVPVGRLRRAIERWVADLDYETVRAAWQDGEGELPEFQQEHHGAEFRIEALPRLRTKGELRDRAIGIEMPDAEWVQDHVAVREAVTRKSGRYGVLELPYIVAVNALTAHGEEHDAVDALFGSDCVELIRTADGGFGHRNARMPDGVWYGRGGPVNTRVSAVLSTERLTPWTLGERRARLFLNPWAARPLQGRPLPVDRRHLENERIVGEQGQSVRELLGLAEGWPRQ